MISKAQRDATRRLADEFRRLTEHGNFSDFAVVNRYSELSARLSLLVPSLLDEIERLRQGTPAEAGRFVKVDPRGGVA